MQLHLTIAEFELLKQMVEEEKRLSCSAMPSLPQVSAQPRLLEELEIGCNLMGKGLSRNLQMGFDELEQLADSLNWRKKQLMREIGCLAEQSARSPIERELLIVERFLEKVTEACAMI